MAAQSVPRNVSTTLGLRTSSAFPLRAKGRVVGMMVVEGLPEETSQVSRTMNILSGIAHQTAIAIENTRLVTELALASGSSRNSRWRAISRPASCPPAAPKCPAGKSLLSGERRARWAATFTTLSPCPRSRGAGDRRRGDKGVPAALFMAVTRTLTRAAAIHSHRTPAEVLMRLNEMILADARSDLFVTIFFADLSPVGRVASANAGHNPPLVVRATTGEVETIKPHGMALGVMPEVTLRDQQTKLENGDVLVLYTDGVTDALDARGREFGLERLERCIVKHRHQSADGLVAPFKSHQ